MFIDEVICPDRQKVQAVVEASEPTNASEVRGLFGMLNYGSRFIPDYATNRHTHKDLE